MPMLNTGETGIVGITGIIDTGITIIITDIIITDMAEAIASTGNTTENTIGITITITTIITITILTTPDVITTGITEVATFS